MPKSESWKEKKKMDRSHQDKKRVPTDQFPSVGQEKTMETRATPLGLEDSPHKGRGAMLPEFHWGKGALDRGSKENLRKEEGKRTQTSAQEERDKHMFFGKAGNARRGGFYFKGCIARISQGGAAEH